MKIATFATIPDREMNAQKVVEDVIGQVDRIQIYFNGYGKEIPEWARREKVVAYHGMEDLGDAGKFWDHDQEDSYYFVLDDDLFYPDDLIDVLVEGIERYGRKCAVATHGRLINPVLSGRFESYYRGVGTTLWSYRTLNGVDEDSIIHIPGTHSFAYHTDTIRFSIDDFRYYWPDGRNMADIWTGIKCRRHDVPVICLAHEKGWVRHQPIDYNKTIFAQEVNHDPWQTQALNEFGPWRFKRLPDHETQPRLTLVDPAGSPDASDGGV